MALKKLGIAVISLTLVASALGGCTSSVKETQSAEVQTTEAQETTQESESTEMESAENEAYSDYFVTSEWLQSQTDNENLVILDGRGQEAYDKGHIPGALAASWQGLSTMDVEFASEMWGTVKDAQALGQALSALGLKKDSQVVVYADTQNGWGEDGRIMWSLQAAGIGNVKMLDGGLEGWKNAGFDLTKETVEVTASDFVVEEVNKSESIDTETLVAEYNDYKIIDTRDRDEYEGAQKFGEARGGHLPGAIWMPYKDLMQKDGSLKSIDELEAVFAQAGLEKTDKIATYCTAGIRSAHFAEILKMLGYENVKNYDASFYVWANTPDLKLGRVVKDYAYNYYTPEQLKATLEAQADLTLLDIQPENDFAKHHITGALETNAYPVKSDDDKAKLEINLENLRADGSDIVIVCPRGGGGAERTYQYLEEQGLDTNRLYILEGGQADWPFADLLDK